MKTIIEIENGKISIEVDDGQEIKQEIKLEPARVIAPADDLPDLIPCVVCGSKFKPIVKHVNRRGYCEEHVPEELKSQLPIGKEPPLPKSNEKKICEQCGKSFFPLKHVAARARYCSKACRYEANNRPDLAKNLRNKEAEKEAQNEVVEVVKAADTRRSEFVDRWNCGMCRNAGDLCLLHEKMEKDGKKPPKYNHWGNDNASNK
jgi:hypothetical protein